MMEIGIFQHLKTSDGILAIAGSRIYAVMMPKGSALPTVVYSKITPTSTIQSLKGRNKAESARFQFDSYAPSHGDSVRLSNLVRDLFAPDADDVADDFYPITLPDGSEIQSATVHLDVDAPFEVAATGTGFTFRRILDIEFFFIPAN
jgi:hypothetical protein